VRVAIVIPARIESKRFPEKIFAKYFDNPIIQHVLETGLSASNTLTSSGIKSRVFVVSEKNDERLQKITANIGGEYLVQEQYVNCGSERVMHVFEKVKEKFDYYITIPADEPAIDSYELYKSVIRVLKWNDGINIYTFFTQFYNKKDLKDVKSCKIVTDNRMNILYTSRAIIPASKSGDLHNIEQYKKHVGVFIFPRRLLKKHGYSLWYDLRINKYNVSALEGLEQNMFLGHPDFSLLARPLAHIGFGVDSPEQIEKLEKRFTNK
jgi:3-deoxy-manno-octulosonate cytidylyltransferase (CMP-KDO synthetase)